MEHFLKIDDREVLSISISDNHEELVDLKEEKEIILDMSRKHIWNKNKSFSLVRKRVGKKLLLAQQHLPDGLKLKIIEGYRSPDIQREIFEWQKGEFRKQHSDWAEEHLLDETSKFVASLETITPHSTGGAVDLTLISENNSELDMGTPVNDGYDGQCQMNADTISNEAKKNRGMLKEVLEEAGFVNYPAEWWHWSYGDRYWAMMTKNNSAIYGRVEI